MGEYTELLGPEASQEDFLRIAQHFQETGKPLMAGKFFLKAKQYAKVQGGTCLHTCIHAHIRTRAHTHTHVHTHAHTRTHT